VNVDFKVEMIGFKHREKKSGLEIHFQIATTNFKIFLLIFLQMALKKNHYTLVGLSCWTFSQVCGIWTNLSAFQVISKTWIDISGANSILKIWMNILETLKSISEVFELNITSFSLFQVLWGRLSHLERNWTYLNSNSDIANFWDHWSTWIDVYIWNFEFIKWTYS